MSLPPSNKGASELIMDMWLGIIFTETIMRIFFSWNLRPILGQDKIRQTLTWGRILENVRKITFSGFVSWILCNRSFQVTWCIYHDVIVLFKGKWPNQAAITTTIIFIVITKIILYDGFPLHWPAFRSADSLGFPWSGPSHMWWRTQVEVAHQNNKYWLRDNNNLYVQDKEFSRIDLASFEAD